MDRMQTERDDSLKAHLATKVMGRREGARSPSGARVWIDDATGGAYYDSSLDSWADAGKAWEKARENRQTLLAVEELLLEKSGIEGYRELFWFLKYATPRLLCEVVATATGWEEPK